MTRSTHTVGLGPAALAAAGLMAGIVVYAGLAPPAAAAPREALPRAECPLELEILVERAFARARGLAPGDRVTLSADPDSPRCSAAVAGVFEPPPDPSRLTSERPRLLFHLPQLAALVGRSGEVDHFTVRLAPGSDAERTATELERLLPGTQVLPTATVSDRASTTFEVVSRFHRAIGVITLVAGGVFLACIMILKVQERRTPIAAARLAGVSGRTLLGWLVAEAALVSFIGGLLGLGLGYAASAAINAYYQGAYETTLVFSHVTGETVMRAIALALGLGLAAGLVAAARLFSDNPLEEVGR